MVLIRTAFHQHQTALQVILMMDQKLNVSHQLLIVFPDILMMVQIQNVLQILAVAESILGILAMVLSLDLLLLVFNQRFPVFQVTLATDT